MTDQRVPDPSSATDPLGGDPLAVDYGTVMPPPSAASAIPPAPPTAPAAAAAPATPTGAPLDPGADRFSAFDDEQPQQPVAGSPPSPVTGPRRRRSGVARVAVFFGAGMALLVVVGGVGTSLFVSDRGTEGATTADKVLVATPVSVSAAPVEELPATVSRLRIELQGPGRTADVRVYTPDGSRTVDNQNLPYAVDLPVTTDDAYVSVSADDYGFRGSQPMRCTISVGDTVLATAVGTKSVDCKVTDETWRRDR